MHRQHLQYKLHQPRAAVVGSKQHAFLSTKTRVQHDAVAINLVSLARYMRLSALGLRHCELTELPCSAGISEPLAVAAALHSPTASNGSAPCAAVDTMVSAPHAVLLAPK